MYDPGPAGESENSGTSPDTAGQTDFPKMRRINSPSAFLAFQISHYSILLLDKMVEDNPD